jgi:hypothetical protein
MKIYQIEDTNHAEIIGTFDTFENALTELTNIYNIPWNTSPNICPCLNFETCGRDYEIYEYDNSTMPWKYLNSIFICSIYKDKYKWYYQETYNKS